MDIAVAFKQVYDVLVTLPYEEANATYLELFSTEVIKLLGPLQLLDDVVVHADKTGGIDVAYFSQRLLSTQPSLSPRLDNIRRITLRFVRSDINADATIGENERYREYIQILSTLLVKHSVCYVKDLFQFDPWAANPHNQNYDCLTAATLMGNFSIVQELSDRKEIMSNDIGTFRDPYTAAAMNGDIIIIGTLYRKLRLYHPHTYESVLVRQLGAASSIGSARTVEHLLALDWNLNSDWKRVCSWGTFLDALITPDIETFQILMRLKEQTPNKDLRQDQLDTLLCLAAEKGWEDMVNHILKMCKKKAPVIPPTRAMYISLYAACASGSEEVVRLLLRHKAVVHDDMLEIAVKRGRLGIVKILLDHGADTNNLVPHPIVSAVQLEHRDMFDLLLSYGADLAKSGPAAAKEAQEVGLQSMLALLGQHGVGILDR
jgi:hypothetical protein